MLDVLVGNSQLAVAVVGLVADSRIGKYSPVVVDSTLVVEDNNFDLHQNSSFGLVVVLDLVVVLERVHNHNQDIHHMVAVVVVASNVDVDVDVVVVVVVVVVVHFVQADVLCISVDAVVAAIVVAHAHVAVSSLYVD